MKNFSTKNRECTQEGSAICLLRLGVICRGHSQCAMESTTSSLPAGLPDTYRLRNLAHRPYFSGGLNTNYIVNTTDSQRLAPDYQDHPFTLPPSHKPLSELRYRSSEGVVVAGGFEFSLHRIRLAPELRYTRWAHENFHSVLFRSNLDQAELLVTVGLVNPQ